MLGQLANARQSKAKPGETRLVGPPFVKLLFPRWFTRLLRPPMRMVVRETDTIASKRGDETRGGNPVRKSRMGSSRNEFLTWEIDRVRLRTMMEGAMERRIIRAASNALGCDVDEERVSGAVTKYEGIHTNSLRRQLRESVEAFEADGGRGVDLADTIDDLRIVLAVRMAERGTRGR
jgi:hypothetical protein